MNRVFVAALAVALAGTFLNAPVGFAQPVGPSPAAPPAAGSPGPGYGWGPETMMGPGMMGWRGMGGMCNPRAAGLAEWRRARIERLIKPNEAQRKALDDLRAASAKAAETIAAACPREFPASAPARMELMEKRLEAMLTAIKTVRPAFDAFYATLNDEQKARINAGGPRRWGWRGWRSE